MLSSVSFGTTFANPHVTDDACVAALVQAFAGGINVVDAASNYRDGRAERIVARAFREALDCRMVTREGVFFIAKGGFLAEHDGDEHVREPREAVDGHCLEPGYLVEVLEASRRQLAIETIDAFLLHNPETQAPALDGPEFRRRLVAAFRALEACADRGTIARYGVSTWHGLRAPHGSAFHLSLADLLECARAAGGDCHRFEVLAAPLSLSRPELLVLPSQLDEGRRLTTLAMTAARRCTLFATAPLDQGRLLGRLPDEVRDRLPGLANDAQCCLQFARSPAGVTSAICGMSTPAHVDDALAVARVAPLDETALAALLGGP